MINATHNMITAGYRVAEYEEVDIRAIFEAMINTQDARTELIKAGWCPPGGPGNSTTTNVVKTCMNCGTSGCDQKDTRVCASSGCHSLWTPETPNFGMAWRRRVTIFWNAWLTLVTLGRK